MEISLLSLLQEEDATVSQVNMKTNWVNGIRSKLAALHTEPDCSDKSSRIAMYEKDIVSFQHSLQKDITKLSEIRERISERVLVVSRQERMIHMQKTTYINRNEAEARHFYNLVNDRHDCLKAKQKTERTQERIYQIAKKTLAFGGALLFLLCLWMLA